ncbi:Nose resistant to fluoxetine protein 6 like protein [Argiope bruennichi]|uniref:Nose resistant to fluoxetine protein 6 like protein n=1 Tax=Argiope bruennichi TaxID=94029 RepID=A0A8T0G3T7_ARGBR|nr:Nose resistant to fluoxetine protein 6 like protein [Argiope bruennichi]
MRKKDSAFLNEFKEFLGKYNYHILENLLSKNASDKCFRDFKHIFESLPYGGWPVKMLDSFGKPESGILKGNIRWLGEFDECLQIYAPPKKGEGVGDFHGKYCTLKTTLKMMKSDLTLSMAVCLPDTCDSSEIIPDVASYLNLTALILRAIFVIFLISIFILLAVTGSSITLYERSFEANPMSDASSETNFAANPSAPGSESESLFTKILISLLTNKGNNHHSLPAIRNPSWKAWGDLIPGLAFYIHRYIRLTPVYIIVVAFYTTLNKYLGTGPIWPDASAGTDPNCDASWWRNLLYITNFQPDIQKCMAWTWYLANDMQFYIISPLFLVTLWRWPKIGYSVMASFLCATYITSFVISYKYNLVTGLGNIASNISDIDQFFLQWHEYFTKFYVKPYTRFDPYLIGIALAYFLFRRKQINAGKLSRVALSVGWAIASGITFTAMFGLYHQNPSTVASSFYNALNRSCFAFGLAWVIFVCINGQGGVVNSILSWKLLIPLSRLTFCAYLLHPILELVYFYSVTRLIEFSHLTLVLHYLGFLILSYAAALVASLLFESPVIRLEKLIRNKFST